MIFKYPLGVCQVSKDFKILAAKAQHNMPVVYIDTDPKLEQVAVKFSARLTGEELVGTYIDTILLSGDHLVFHVCYEVLTGSC